MTGERKVQVARMFFSLLLIPLYCLRFSFSVFLIFLYLLLFGLESCEALGFQAVSNFPWFDDSLLSLLPACLACLSMSVETGADIARLDLTRPPIMKLMNVYEQFQL
jgi:hypothetical protein